MQFNVHENITLTRFPEVQRQKCLPNFKLEIIGVTLSPTWRRIATVWRFPGREGKVNLNLDIPYTRAVIQEALRVETVTPINVPRMTREDVNLMGYVILKNTQVSTERWMSWWKLFISGPTDHRITTMLLISFRSSWTVKTSNTFDHFSRWCQTSGMSTMTRICGRIREVSTRNDIWTKMGGSWNRTKWFHFPLVQGVAWEKI